MSDDNTVTLEGNICMECLVGELVRGYYRDQFAIQYPDIPPDRIHPHQLYALIAREPVELEKWTRAAMNAVAVVVQSVNHTVQEGMAPDDGGANDNSDEVIH